MPPVDLIDLVAFLRSLRSERQPSLLVHGPPLCGKSSFARKLAEKNGWGYLDVLAMVAIRPELSTQVDRFDIPALRKLLLEQAKADVLVVDELDFLFPLWGDLRPFQEMVRSLVNAERPVGFAFFVQSRPEWNNWNLLTAARQNRVVDFEKIKSL